MSRVYFATKKDLTVGVNFMEELEQLEFGVVMYVLLRV